VPPLSPLRRAPPLPLESAVPIVTPGCVGSQLYPIHVRAAVCIGKVFHSVIPISSQLNLIRAALVTGNVFGPNG